MNTRINVNIPSALFEKANSLVDRGMFSNFSELIREGLRKEVAEYERREQFISDDEQKLYSLLKKAEAKGLLVDEKEIKKHGIKI